MTSLGWFKMEGGLGIPALDAFHNATSPFVQEELGLGWTSATANMGIEMGTFMMEAGYLLDPTDGIGLRFETLLGPSFRGNAAFGTQTRSVRCQPFAFPLTLDYYRFFPMGNQRFFVSAGVGYVLGMVEYSGSAPDYWTSAEFWGGTLCYQLSVGWEYKLRKSLAFTASLNGRIVEIPQVTATYTLNGVSGVPYALVADARGGLLTDGVSNMAAAGETYLPVDFTSLDVRVGFDLAVF